MTALEQLNDYLRRFEARVRWLAAARGTAISAATALLLTVLLVWIADHFRFAQNVVLPLRLLLFAALAFAFAFALAIPLYKINRRRITRLAEQRVPAFAQRLLTVTERPDPSNPFTEIVAEDALTVARNHPPTQFIESSTLLALAGTGGVALAVLVWLITAGPGFWGYGAALLWTGTANAGKRPLYEVLVQPGDRTVRRKSDQLVSAELVGFAARDVTLHAKYGDASKWETVPMQPRPAANGYQFVLAGLSEPVEYYVAADGTRSKHYKLAVRDLLAVKRLRVNLHFPKGLRLKDSTQDPGGDIRAVQGTQAEIAVLTSRPLEHGLLLTDTGAKVELTKGDGNWVTAKLPVTKDGSYHIAAIDSGESIRISDDYFIEAKKDEAPSVKISHPGKDPKVSPIEEVPITVEAADDFGLEGMDLHYSVNGGEEQVVPLLKAKSVKEAQGKTQLSLESFKLSPGDLVSFYATARDANTTSRTDIAFAQAEPFDFKFSQSQQSGGGGGSGNQESDISQRQKQIIAATWNEIKDGGKAAAVLQEEAAFLSGTEAKLSEQAKTLAERMGNRELSGANSEFENFSKVMIQASADMASAVAQLKPAKFNSALIPEQKALQSLLRAEAMFRNIQVAFGQSGGGGGAGGGAQRDLARMFDLELDTSKNQYETGQSQEQAKADQQKAVDDAFERLQALARRQQELAAQNPQQQQPFEQRWQEEQLRREAEELKRQMEQLSQSGGQQNQQGQEQSQQGQSSGSQSSGQRQSAKGQSAQGQSSQSGSQADSQQNGAMSQAMRQSVRALQRAEDEMRKAVSSHDATAQQRASDELAEAQRLMNDALHQQAGNSVADLAQKAQELANAQHDVANQMKDLYGQPQFRSRRPGTPDSASGSGEEMSPMNDPTNRRYYGYGRRAFQPDQFATRTATPEERALATRKERLGKEVERLQHEMQQQEQSLEASQPGASSKLRKALSDAEQKELALRMEKNAEWIRQGYGERNLQMEQEVTAGMDQLSRDMRDVQQALQAGKGGKEAEMLSQLRQLREALQRGQSSSQGNGQSVGQGEQSSPNGARGNNTGIDPRGMQEAMGQLNTLRGQIGPHDLALRGYVDNTLGSLRSLNADPKLLQSAIGQDAVSHLQRLELELSRRLGEPPAALGARTGAAEPSPEKYRDAVAEYFKKLSQPQ
jgi:hypothetical protein